jgi:hypothetical protein
MMISILRAGHSEPIDKLMAMPDDDKQAVLWVYGRAEKPAFLDALGAG